MNGRQSSRIAAMVERYLLVAGLVRRRMTGKGDGRRSERRNFALRADVAFRGSRTRWFEIGKQISSTSTNESNPLLTVSSAELYVC